MIVLCSRMPLESGFPVCKGTEAEARVDTIGILRNRLSTFILDSGERVLSLLYLGLRSHWNVYNATWGRQLIWLKYMIIMLYYTLL